MNATSSKGTEKFDELFNFDKLTEEGVVVKAKTVGVEEINRFYLSISVEKYKKSVARREVIEYEYVRGKSK